MTGNSTPFEPGTLRAISERRIQHALARGALQPIDTHQESIDQAGARFFVRVVSSLVRKGRARAGQGRASSHPGKEPNPFLPYDEDLFVSAVSETHLCLLNKFNVLDHHLLIVTRDFVDQEALLTPNDFEALWACMGEYESLGFYNGGEVAGASQRHKHLQLVPLPLTGDAPMVPIEPLLSSTAAPGELVMLPALPFVHCFVGLAPDMVQPLTVAARLTYDFYRAMLARVNLSAMVIDGEERQSAPYNLLLTRRWMLLVPRSVEHFDSISVNALGFAGSFFVHNAEQLAAIKRHGPINVLRDVAIALANR